MKPYNSWDIFEALWVSKLIFFCLQSYFIFGLIVLLRYEKSLSLEMPSILCWSLFSEAMESSVWSEQTMQRENSRSHVRENVCVATFGFHFLSSQESTCTVIFCKIKSPEHMWPISVFVPSTPKSVPLSFTPWLSTWSFLWLQVYQS